MSRGSCAHPRGPGRDQGSPSKAWACLSRCGSRRAVLTRLTLGKEATGCFQVLRLVTEATAWVSPW